MALRINFNTTVSEICSVEEKFQPLIAEELKKGNIKTVADIENLIVDSDCNNLSSICIETVHKPVQIKISSKKKKK